MVGVLGGGGTSIGEPISLILGFINLISAIFFFLYRYEIIDVGGIIITDEFSYFTFLY